MPDLRSTAHRAVLGGHKGRGIDGTRQPRADSGGADRHVPSAWAAATYNVPPSGEASADQQLGRVPYRPDMEKAPGPSGPEAGVVRVDQKTVKLPPVTIPAVVSDIG
jgi:hypothetical protein